MITSVVTHAPEQTAALAESMATALPSDATLALYGELGSGKTCFVKGLVRGFGSEDLVTSPTFTLVHLYQAVSGKIRHFDLYRIKSEVEIEELDILRPDGSILTVIEWPDVMERLLPDNTVRVRFGLVEGEENARKIDVEIPGEAKGDAS